MQSDLHGPSLPSGSAPDKGVRRRRLHELTASPTDVLRTLRDRDRPVALIGSWRAGETLIACDPVRVAEPGDDPFALVDSGAGWWVGAWGYRLGSRLERLPDLGPRPMPQPEHRLALYDRVLRRVDGEWFVEYVEGADPSTLVKVALGEPVRGSAEVGRFAMTPSPAEHRDAVARAIGHIRAGDIFQVNLCARLEAPFAGDPLEVFYRGVESLTPAYAAYVADQEGAIVSLSPELFLRRSGDTVLTSPIKGTAPLERDPAELVGSAKDRAENVMIVDLMRNDLGRVCVPGSVRVPDLMRAERHTVWHLVSDVTGQLPPGTPNAELLRATFPPGSVTGAPKLRAIEVAAELEATSRETYTGAIGVVTPAKDVELNVAIRTFEIAGGRIWLGVGGGIVSDSTPESEYAECLHKAAPLVDAIGGEIDHPPGEQAMTPRHVAPTDAGARPVPPRNFDTGVFTTLLVRDGEAVDLDAHLARLRASARELLGRELPAELPGRVRTAAPAGTHRLRIDLTRDEVGITVAPFDPEPVEPLRLTRRTVAGGLGTHKWRDRRLLEPGDLLLVDTDDSVLETDRANLFAVLDDGVHTPPLDGRILPGTMRALVLARLRELDLPVVERRLGLTELARASEVFATNALRGAVPVHAIEGVGAWPTGPVTRLLREDARPQPAPEPKACKGRPRVLFIDNYDSFVFNLVQYARELGADCEVVRNDEVAVEEITGFSHLVVSPGPGTPAEAGISVDAIRALGPVLPVLGVCLGHQAIAEAYSGTVTRSDVPVHGKPAIVHHDGRGIFTGVPTPFAAARYHSLLVDEATLPADLEVTARTGSGVVMGLRHKVHPVEGVQLHPESILTAHGHRLLAGFLGGGAIS